VAALLFTLLLAVPAAANAQATPTPTPEPVVETDTATCEAQVAGWPTFYANVDAAFTLYPGDREYTILSFFNARGTVADDGDDNTQFELRGYTGGGEVAPGGPPNVVVHGSATMVRWRWSWLPWSWGWYEDGQTAMSCGLTTYVGI
jgi:hypothetical protein